MTPRGVVARDCFYNHMPTLKIVEQATGRYNLPTWFYVQYLCACVAIAEVLYETWYKSHNTMVWFDQGFSPQRTANINTMSGFGTT